MKDDRKGASFEGGFIGWTREVGGTVGGTVSYRGGTDSTVRHGHVHLGTALELVHDVPEELGRVGGATAMQRLRGGGADEGEKGDGAEHLDGLEG